MRPTILTPIIVRQTILQTEITTVGVGLIIPMTPAITPINHQITQSVQIIRIMLIILCAHRTIQYAILKANNKIKRE